MFVLSGVQPSRDNLKYFVATVAAGCRGETQQPFQWSEDSNVCGIFAEENFLSKLPQDQIQAEKERVGPNSSPRQ